MDFSTIIAGSLGFPFLKCKKNKIVVVICRIICGGGGGELGVIIDSLPPCLVIKSNKDNMLKQCVFREISVLTCIMWGII